MGIIRRVFFTLLTFMLLAGATSRGLAQTTTEWLSDETGFVVRGAFLDYYQSTEHALALFGYPITAEISDNMGHRFQYFQKARFDLDESTGVVSSGTLGSYLYNAGEYETANITMDNSLCRVFPNGYTVCYGFLQFYNAKNGAKYLGLPISDTEINGSGYLTQYFENGILEWNPDLGTGRRVQVVDIGRIYYERTIGFLPTPQLGSSIGPAVPLIPQVNVFTSRAIVSANSVEEIFVIVKDQFQRPLPNARVSIKITLPDGMDSEFPATFTNSDGISKLDILIGDFQPQDVIHITATVVVAEETDLAKTWLRVWW